MEIKYQVHTVPDIMKFFVDGFKLPDGQKIWNYEWFYDPHKGKVVFRLEIITNE